MSSAYTVRYAPQALDDLPENFQLFYNKPIDNLGKWGYNPDNKSTNLVGN